MSTSVQGTAQLASTPALAAPPLSGHPPRERLLSLDVFRGATIAGMLLVNTPGTWSAIYPPLEHATWNGWTPTDLIFPFFLFIVGITTHLSRESRRARGDDERAIVVQTLRRGAVIVLLGLALAAVPMSYDLARYPDQLHALRIPGVLQRIGVAYIAAALLTRRTSLRTQIAIIAAILLGYWAVMTLVPVPGSGLLGWQTLGTPSATLSAWLDRTLLGGHLWRDSRTWDPEGILTTVPAVATTMLGVLAGRAIASRAALAERIAGIFAVGCMAMVAGLVWNWVFPINKNLWTSSYVLFTAGAAAATVATCLWLVDARGWRRWTTPFVVFGVNPIAAYVGSEAMARLIYTTTRVNVDGHAVPLQTVIFERAFASWLPLRMASLLFAVAFVFLWFGIMWVLYRRRIFLKV
ncbi:MAG TPA: heparan-alpha-glucosaminide N-acetyltransferase domain-containing protein [Gemmatimonadaceae bacterium]|nr:heparan-alpha-glucosaminide N-acetyltransferase domain-containing protein [Gemmatimonadaceae bacterium]